ncbi:MAG: hypothetical protein ACFFC7_04750 [Candidatus Hermodarchaeota archaeon]
MAKLKHVPLTRKYLAELLFIKMLSLKELKEVLGIHEYSIFDKMRKFQFPKFQNIYLTLDLRQKALSYLGEERSRSYKLNLQQLLDLPDEKAIINELERPAREFLAELLLVKNLSNKEIGSIINRNEGTVIRLIRKFRLLRFGLVKKALYRRNIALSYLGEERSRYYELDLQQLLALPDEESIYTTLVSPLKDVLEELAYEKQLPLSEQVNILGLPERTLTLIRKEFNLRSFQKVKIASIRRNVVTDFLRLSTKETIGERYKITRFPIVPMILEQCGVYNDFDLNSFGNCLDYWIPLSSELEEIILGFLLGDGHIRKSTKRGISLNSMPTDDEFLNAVDTLNLFKRVESFPLYVLPQKNSFPGLPPAIRQFNKATRIILASGTSKFRLHKSILETLWLAFVAEVFRQNGCPVTLKPGYQKQNGVIIDIEFNTPHIMQFERLRQEWYEKSPSPSVNKYHPLNKIVRIDIVLTPLSTLCWLVDDGSTSSSTDFSTQGFSLPDIKFLRDLLSREIDAPLKIYKSHRLGVPMNSLNCFFDYINLAPPHYLEVAKACFPWKFDRRSPKKQIYDCESKFVDETYFQRYLLMLERFVGKETALFLGQQIFPWKFE